MDNVNDDTSLTLWLLLHSQAYVSQPKALVTKDSTLLECDDVSLGVQFPVFQRTTMLSSLQPGSPNKSLVLDCLAPKIKTTHSLQKLETTYPMSRSHNWIIKSTSVRTSKLIHHKWRFIITNMCADRVATWWKCGSPECHTNMAAGC